MNPLLLAAIKNNVEIGKLLIEHKISINSKDIDGHTSLMYAIKNNSKDFVQFLLSQKELDINYQDIFVLKILNKVDILII